MVTVPPLKTAEELLGMHELLLCCDKEDLSYLLITLLFSFLGKESVA